MILPKQDDVLTTNSTALLKMLKATGSSFNIVDCNYRCPTEKWLIDVAGERYVEESFFHGFRVYHREEWDCDERAVFYYICSRGVHRIEDITPAMALAVGTVCYVPDEGGGHMICWAIADRNGEKVLVFIDPGEVPELISLSDTEKETLRHWMI